MTDNSTNVEHQQIVTPTDPTAGNIIITNVKHQQITSTTYPTTGPCKRVEVALDNNLTNAQM
jgi:hypothetical protein